MSMLTSIYQEYLHLIGKLKDVYKLDAVVEHKDIHSFYQGKKLLFKLFYGQYVEKEDSSVVVSFHIDLFHAEAINWFINIYNLFPLVKIHDSFIEDSNGDTYIGEDAMVIREVYMAQDILGEWLETHTEEEIRDFVGSKVVGSAGKDKSYNSQIEYDEAIMNFKQLKKPGSEDGVH